MAITKLELQSHLQAVFDELEQYKSTNHHLQFEINNKKLLNLFTEQQNRTLKMKIKGWTKLMKNSRKCYEIRIRKYHILKVRIKTLKEISQIPRMKKNHLIEAMTI